MVKPKLTSEQREEIVQRVRKELVELIQSPYNTLTRGNKLSNDYGVSDNVIWKLLSNNLSPQELIIRKNYIRQITGHEVGSKNYQNGIGLAAISPERRSEIGKFAFIEGTGIHAISPNERSRISRETGLKNYQDGIGLAAISSERRSEIGRNGGRKSNGGKKLFLSKKGIHALSQKERSRIGLKIGLKNYQNGIGLAAISHERRLEICKKGGRVTSERSANVYWRGNYYQSASEAAIADLFQGNDLERRLGYLPNWSVQRGKSWQIKDKGISNGGIDFLIYTQDGMKFLEYHPPRICSKGGRNGGDLKNGEEYGAYVSEIKELRKESPEAARTFQKLLKMHISADYISSRTEAIERSGYKGTPLVYCATEEEVYQKIIAPYGQKQVSLQDFKHEFKLKVKEIKTYQKTLPQDNLEVS